MTAYITLPLAEYVALLQAARQLEPDTRTGNGLAAAVAILTARQAGIETTARELTPDTDLGEIVRILTTLATALLDGATRDQGASLLQALGLAAQDQT